MIADSVRSSILGGVVLCPIILMGDLVGHWRFDEASGEVAGDGVSGHDGRWVPGGEIEPNWHPGAGLLGGAVRFPGSGNHQNYFSVHGFPSFNGIHEGASISIWVRPEGASGYRGIFMGREVRDSGTGGGTGQVYGLGHEDTHADGRVSGLGVDTAAGSVPISTEWIHLAWVWDNSAGTQQIFVNGVTSGPLQTNGGYSAGMEFLSNGEWRIGDDACCSGRNFKGWMDDLSFWDEALSESEVAILYQNGLAGGAAGDVAPPPETEPLNVGLIINEVHYDAEPKTRFVEFVELLNTNDAELDLSGVNFSDGINFTFPEGTLLEATSYVLIAENAAQLVEDFGQIPEGTRIFEYTGSLSSEGEKVELRSASGALLDQVDYRPEFPWPISPNGEGASMQLTRGALDNDLGGVWRGASPTPGIQNSIFLENGPPILRQVTHSPDLPGPADPIMITVKATDPDGVNSLTLVYQVVAPGEFIPASLPLSSAVLKSDPTRLLTPNPEFEDPGNWTEIAMRDDGDGGDVVAGDNIYTAVLSAQNHRTLVRYRIVAEDLNGASVRVPYADDPSLNFACFVYGGIPAYTADLDSVHPEGAGHRYGTEVLNQLPAFHLITDAEHLGQCWAYDSSDRVSSVASRKAFNWEGAMVFEGKVFDHIRYRLRQKNDRYAGQGRRSMRFRFQRGNYLAARDPTGELYPFKWRSMNTSKMSRFAEGANHGMRELVSSRLWNLAGVPAPEFQHVHFRVIDDAFEAVDQYHGDFHGMAMIFEDVDGQFLKNRNLPGGNVYKLKDGASSPKELQKYQARGAVNDARDFVTIRDLLGPPNQGDQWLRDHVDWASYYLYAALGEGFRHYDFSPAFQKNRIWYFRPESGFSLGKMSIIPHDTDATWKRGTNDGQWYDPRYSGGTLNGVSYRGRVVGIDLPKEAIQEISGLDGTDGENHPERAEFMLEYRNTLREVADLLWQPEIVNGVIDDAYQKIADFSLADRDRWSNGPADAGHENIGPLESQITKMKSLAFTEDLYMGVSKAGGRRQRLLDLAEDPWIPHTPVISYTGADAYTTGGLRFGSSGFLDPRDASFGAMEWRVAGVLDEWNTAWESGEQLVFHAGISVPATATRVGERYRARVRYQNASGRWSHWSEAIEFTVGAPDLNSFANSLVVSEVMFRPAPPSAAELAEGFFSENDFEFLEIRNVGESTVDLCDLRFTKGVDFDFAGSAILVLAPGEFVLVIEDLNAFEFRYGSGLPVAGEWSGGLNREGERLKLSYGAGTEIRDFHFGIEAPWPEVESGKSLTLMHPRSVPDHGDPWSWRGSVALGGSPGGSDGLSFPGGEVLDYAIGSPVARVEVGREGQLDYSLEINQRADDLEGRLMMSSDLSHLVPAGGFEQRTRVTTSEGFARVTFSGSRPSGVGKFFLRYEVLIR
ncbi:lamin tail domain-containing protein [Verrucomicrobiaceae bacterium 227]